MLAIAVHGGAGTLPRAELTTAKRQAFRAGLEAALRAGYAHLERRSSSLDAVVAAVRVLEDDPLFNAGRGAVYAANGTIELDARMDGATLRAGAVAGVRSSSPIELARRRTEHRPRDASGQGGGVPRGRAWHGAEQLFATDHRRLESSASSGERQGGIAMHRRAVGLSPGNSGGTSTGGLRQAWGVSAMPIIGAGGKVKGER